MATFSRSTRMRSKARPEGIEPPALGFEGRHAAKLDNLFSAWRQDAQAEVNRLVSAAERARTWDAICRRIEQVQSWIDAGVSEGDAIIASSRAERARRLPPGRREKACQAIGLWLWKRKVRDSDPGVCS